jgi:hypothetical protein
VFACNTRLEFWTRSQADTVSKATYNGHDCRHVNSVVRIIRFAKDVKGADLDAGEVKRKVAQLGFEPLSKAEAAAKKAEAAAKKAATATTAAPATGATDTGAEASGAAPGDKKGAKRKAFPDHVLRLGRVVHSSYNNPEEDATEEEQDADKTNADCKYVKRAKKLGKLVAELGLPCLFDDTGRPVKDGLDQLTKNSAAIAEADAGKLRRLLMFYGEVVQAPPATTTTTTTEPAAAV